MISLRGSGTTSKMAFNDTFLRRPQSARIETVIRYLFVAALLWGAYAGGRQAELIASAYAHPRWVDPIIASIAFWWILPVMSCFAIADILRRKSLEHPWLRIYAVGAKVGFLLVVGLGVLVFVVAYSPIYSLAPDA